MKLNVGAAIRKEKERLERPISLPVIKVKAKNERPKMAIGGRANLEGGEFVLAPPLKQATAQQLILDELWASMTVAKKERAKLSTQSASLVTELQEHLHKQSPAMAIEFMKGNMPMTELAAHAANIQAYTDKAIALWDEIQHVMKYGTRPEIKMEAKPSETNDSAAAISNEITRLNDLIYKTHRTITQINGGLKGPTKSARLDDYKIKMALACAKRDELRGKIKRIQYGARG